MHDDAWEVEHMAEATHSSRGEYPAPVRRSSSGGSYSAHYGTTASDGGGLRHSAG